MEILWDGFTRFYFNAYEEGPLFWSLDQGIGTPEIKASSVQLEGTCTMITVVDAASKMQPRAWLEGKQRVGYDLETKLVTLHPSDRS